MRLICIILLPFRSEKEARKFNAKLLQRQTQLENQVEQLSSALKELTGSNGQSISAGSPTSTLHVPEQYAPSPPVDSGNTYVGPESSGETGGVLRLEKDGESIYVGAGGSSWALQQVGIIRRYFYCSLLTYLR